MKTLNLLGLNIELSATLEDVGVYFPNSSKDDKSIHNHFNVTVKINSYSHTFDFYGSQTDHDLEVTELEDENLLIAFECFISDAASGSHESFEDFCDEFGYDTDSIRAENVYNACKDSFDALKGMLDNYNVDVYDLAEALG